MEHHVDLKDTNYTISLFGSLERSVYINPYDTWGGSFFFTPKQALYSKTDVDDTVWVWVLEYQTTKRAWDWLHGVVGFESQYYLKDPWHYKYGVVGRIFKTIHYRDNWARPTSRAYINPQIIFGLLFPYTRTWWLISKIQLRLCHGRPHRNIKDIQYMPLCTFWGCPKQNKCGLHARLVFYLRICLRLLVWVSVPKASTRPYLNLCTFEHCPKTKEPSTCVRLVRPLAIYRSLEKNCV